MMVEMAQKGKQPNGWPLIVMAQKLLVSQTTKWLWYYIPVTPTPLWYVAAVLIHFPGSVSASNISHCNEEGKVKEEHDEDKMAASVYTPSPEYNSMILGWMEAWKAGMNSAWWWSDIESLRSPKMQYETDKLDVLREH